MERRKRGILASGGSIREVPKGEKETDLGVLSNGKGEVLGDWCMRWQVEYERN